ncbi:hypothetical protein D3C80_1912040 [compost metagenome]
MRRSHAHLARPFRLPGGPLIAGAGMLLTLVVIAACFQLEIEMLSALAVLAVVLVLNYLVRAARAAKPIATENPDHV